jgi:FG-GAP-like repeat/Bacterial Ig-like domain
MRTILRSISLSTALLVCLPATSFGQLSVITVSPTLNRLAVPVTAPIRIEFDRPVDPSTISSRSITAFGRWSGTVTGSFQLGDGNRTVYWQPDNPFSAGEVVTISLSENLRGADSSTFRTEGYSSQFWTASQRVSNLGFSSATSMSTGSPSRPYGGVATDLNNDGWLDITSVNEDSADLRVFLNLADGTGNFAPYATPTYAVGQRASPSEAADFNGDGNSDIAVANINVNSVSILLGNGDGTYAPQQSVAVGSMPRGIAVLDVDGDADPDIVNTNQASGNLSLLINDGQGVFGPAVTINSSLNGEWSLASGDMNRDGLLDLIVASGSASQIQVLTSNGDGTFTPRAVRNLGGRSWMINVGDVNGDGLLDVASANAQSGNGSILLGNGDGTLQPATTYNLPGMGSGSNGFPLATDLGDLDGDGDLDWVTSSFNGEFLALTNNGNGQFQFFAEFDAPTAASCALMFDRDNDGDLDLGLFDELANVLLLRNNTGTPVGDGDFDADGDLDVSDLNALVQQVASPSGSLVFDLTGDGVLDDADLANWLVLGGAANLPSGNPFLKGDSNLDGFVDGSDFGAWNAHKFTNTAAWTAGDFNADGVVDGTDFGIWNSHKFQASDALTTVPEISGVFVIIPMILLGLGRHIRAEG